MKAPITKDGANGERPATISVERPIRDGFGTSTILIDGKVAGELRRGRRTVLDVAAGDYLLTVFPDNILATPFDEEAPNIITENSPATIRLQVLAGESIELVCQSNQPRLHPWVYHAFWCILLFVIFGLGQDYIPAIRPVAAYLVIPMLIVLLIGLVFGFIGLIIWFQRAYNANAFSATVVSLTLKARKQC